MNMKSSNTLNHYTQTLQWAYDDVASVLEYKNVLNIKAV